MKKLLNFRPMIFIALSLCCGIATAYFFDRKAIVWAVVFCSFFSVSSLLFLFCFTKREKLKRNCIFVTITILFFAFGLCGFNAQIARYKSADLDGHYYAVSGKVISSNETDVGLKLVVGDVFIKGNRTGKLKYNVSLLVYGNSTADVGDLITFNTKLSDKTHTYEHKFNASDVERGIKYQASVNAEDLIIEGKSLTIFERVNLSIRDTLKLGLDRDEFSVAYALLTGNSSLMDYDLITTYRTAGVAHVFAVSGLHIGFLASIITFLLKKVRLNGIIKAIITTLVLLFYSGVCGFSASSLRATIMTAVTLFASARGQRYDPLSAVALAGTLILLVAPVQLFSVGFQLSFMVVIGILLLSAPIKRLFKFLPKKVAGALGVVFSAQIFAVPIFLYAFKEFSLISVIANLLFIPLVAIVFTLTLFCTILGMIFSAPAVTLFVCNYVFKAINFCIAFFDQPFFMIGGLVFGGATISYYALFLLLSGLINVKGKLKSVLAIVLAVTCLSTVVVTTSIESGRTSVYVSGADKLCATMIDANDENVLIISDVSYIYSANRLKRIKDDCKEEKINHLVLMGGYPIDIQVFLSKLFTVFSVENVYYYGERDVDMETIVVKSFKNIGIKNYLDGQNLPINCFSCLFALQGNVLFGELKGKRIAIFSSFKSDDVNFFNFTIDADIMVCADRADELLSYYSPKRKISYRHSNLYENAENNGNLCFKII